jgi:drug/metabolite transporter (DMT)-like permease
VTAAAGQRPSRAAVILPFVTVTLIWGSTWLVIRGQLGIVPPSWSVCYRFVIAGLVLIAFAAFRRERLVLDRGGLAFATALGLAQFVLNFNLVYRAEHYVTSGLVALVFALLIVPNAVFARIFLGRPIERRFVGASAVAIAGVAMLFLHEVRADASSDGGTMLGIGFTLLGVLSASAANVMQASERATRYPMTVMLGWSMLIGAVCNALFALGTVGAPVMDWQPGYIAGLLYLGIIASSLAFTLYFGLVRAIGPAMAAYSGVIVPMIAMLLSTLFEGYRWSPLAVIGCALALGGLLLALRAPKTDASPAR